MLVVDGVVGAPLHVLVGVVAVLVVARVVSVASYLLQVVGFVQQIF